MGRGSYSMAICDVQRHDWTPSYVSGKKNLKCFTGITRPAVNPVAG